VSISDFPSTSARRYLRELDDALASAPPALRSEIVADLASELRGLDESAASARISELGDPQLIAADATNEAAAGGTSDSATARPVLSRTYATITGVVLTAGWYLVPVIGWVAGLVMIGIGSEWTPSVRRTAIGASILGTFFAIAGLIVFRGTEIWVVGATIFAVAPLLVNIFVTSYLRSRWGTR
jgi:uncharacterized membrane protein